jgi:hypothetical protein
MAAILQIVGEFKEIESAHFLDLDADFNPEGWLYHCLSNHTDPVLIFK